MRRDLNRLIPSLFLSLALLSPAGVRAQPSPPLPHSPRLERRSDWAAPDFPSGANLVDAAAASSPSDDITAAPPDYPTRAYWTRMVFQGVVDDNWEIFSNDGSDVFHLTRLTSHPAADFNPKLSPNADQVVFVSNRDSNAEIYRMNSDGSGLVRLTTNPAADGQPDWSPDGQKIVFVSDRGGKPALYKMNNDGSQVQQLTQSNASDFNPDWSPDGKQIAWVRVNDQNIGQVMVMDASGENQRALTGDLVAPDRVSWSASGQYLAVDADLDQNGWIDIGWFPLNEGSSIIDICPPYPNIDCWLGGWYADDKNIVYSMVTFFTSANQVYLDTALLREISTENLGSGGSPFHFSTYADLHLNADAQVVDNTLPASVLQPIPRFLPFNQVALTWSGSDPGPARLYDINILQKTSPAGNWAIVPGTESWGYKMLDSSSHLLVLPPGAPGQTLYFASRARDMAENLELLPANWDAFTTTYAVKTQSQVTDSRGQPLADLVLHLDPAPLNSEPLQTDAAGRLTTYHAGNVLENFQVENLPIVPAQLDQDRSLRVVLLAAANALNNGAFEEGLTGWVTTGTVSNEPAGHSGQAARLGAACPPPCQTSKEEFVQVYNPSLQMVVDSQNDAHLLVNATDYWLRGAAGGWLHPDQPFGIQGGLISTVIRLDDQDTLHVLYSTQYGVIYLQKPKNGDWKNIEYVDYYPVFKYYPLKGWIDVDQQGQVHVAYPENVSQYPRYFYARRGTDGVWSQRLQIPSALGALAAAPDGGAYLFYDGQMQHVSPAGDLESPIWLGGCNVTAAQSDNQGQVQALCLGNPLQYRVLSKQSEWTVEHSFSDYYPTGSFFSRDGSAIFYSKEGYYDPNIQVMVKQPDSQEFEYYDYDTGQHAIEVDELSMAVSRQSGLHITNSGIGSAFYRRSQINGQNTESSLSQTVSIPADLNQPTLSFLYQLEAPAQLVNSGLNVTLTTADNTTIDLFSDRSVGLWQHGWADLSQWSGETVTLSFRYLQAVGEPTSSLLLDEISLAAWETPTIQTVSPNPAFDWISGQTTITIHGSNFAVGAIVRINQQDLPSAFSSPETLSFQLPAGLPPGQYTLKVINPGGIPSNPVNLRLGYPTLLPVISR